MTDDHKIFDFNGLIILEMANNHQGDVEHGKKIISSFAPVAHEAGVRAAVKLQLRDLDTFIHPDFRESTEYKHIPRFISTGLSNDEFRVLVEATEDAGLTSMATPFDERSVDTIDKLGVEVIKVASCSAADWPLLERIAQAGKPVVCSTGGLSIEQVDNLVSFFEHRGVHFALMHCVSIYPTPLHKLGLERIRIFKKRYPHTPIGYSTHEEPDNIDAVKVAYASGARLFERHVGVPTDTITLNAYSSRPEQIALWLDAYNDAVAMSGTEVGALDPDDEDEADQLALQMRGVYAKKQIKKGARIKQDDVFFAMPLQEGGMSSGSWRPNFVADRTYKKNEPLSVVLVPTTLTPKQTIYKIVHDIKGILNTAHSVVNDESHVTLMHPEGLVAFSETGMCRIDCINEAYAKRLVVLLPGQCYPEHYHEKRDKTLQLLFGFLTVSEKGKHKTLYAGDTLTVPRGVWHAYSAGENGAVIEEISENITKDDTHYTDKKIEKLPQKERQTELIHWGRHQFDSPEGPTYYD